MHFKRLSIASAVADSHWGKPVLPVAAYAYESSRCCMHQENRCKILKIDLIGADQMSGSPIMVL